MIWWLLLVFIVASFPLGIVFGKAIQHGHDERPVYVPGPDQ